MHVVPLINWSHKVYWWGAVTKVEGAWLVRIGRMLIHGRSGSMFPERIRWDRS